jgi:UDP-3-O-[3-hydroxymyristoyl] glucosamine N-acyltransferase
MKLSELSDFLKGRLFIPDGAKDKSPVIKRLAPIDKAGNGDITFVANPEYEKFLKTTNASAVIVKEQSADCVVPQIILKNPYAGFAKTAQLFQEPPKLSKQVSQQAFIGEHVKLGANVTVFPFAYIDDGAEIGDDAVIYPGVYVGKNVTIGKNSTVYANAVIYDGCKIGARVIIHSGAVIGGDGFGFAVGDGEIIKIPQVGIVVLEDDVEVGATTTVDRAAMGVTKVGRGTKLDSKVQIGHNVETGEHCMLSAFVGLAGTSKIGNWVIMGAYAGLNGHTKIADGCQIAAKCGVISDIEEKGVYMGFPHMPAGEWRRQQVYLRKLGEFDKRLKALEKSLER